MKLYAVAIQSNFVKALITTTEVKAMILEDVTPIVATIIGSDNTAVIAEVSSSHQIPQEMLVAFELAI